jgi:hypothetical protein
MHQPRIAILILNWKKTAETILCVKSVLRISYWNYKIFLIDNSADNKSCGKFQKEFGHNAKIRLLQTNSNLGYAGGNNYGSKIAFDDNYFDYLCILNNDTYVHKDFLKHLVQEAAKTGGNNIYTPLILAWKSDIIQSGGLNDYLPTAFQFGHKMEKDKGMRKIEESPYLRGCCFLIKANIYKKLEGFREDFFMYGEDIDFGRRAQKKGGRIYLIPTAKIWHKISKFSPASAYYTARNTFHLIHEQIPHKEIEYLRAAFWFILLILINLYRLKFSTAAAFIWGILAFFRKEYFRNPSY